VFQRGEKRRPDYGGILDELRRAATAVTMSDDGNRGAAFEVQSPGFK
jgi:hypothetical protein